MSDCPPKPLDAEFERFLLIALNSAETMPRDAALKLAQRPAEWLHEPNELLACAAAEVDRGSLQAARETARRAARISAVELRRAHSTGATILTRLDPEYPQQLHDLEIPPAVLYCRGHIPASPAIAIVGSRRADPYGREAAAHFASRLAGYGLVIVSGFAVGIDTAAHRATIEAGGETVAVLGCGVDVDYPRSNRKLRELVANSGAIVSEFRIGTHPEAWRFPVRKGTVANFPPFKGEQVEGGGSF